MREPRYSTAEERRAARDYVICMARLTGCPVRLIAVAFNLSHSRVYQICGAISAALNA